MPSPARFDPAEVLEHTVVALVRLVAAADYQLDRKEARDIVESVTETIVSRWEEAAAFGELDEANRKLALGRMFLNDGSVRGHIGDAAYGALRSRNEAYTAPASGSMSVAARRKITPASNRTSSLPKAHAAPDVGLQPPKNE